MFGRSAASDAGRTPGPPGIDPTSTERKKKVRRLIARQEPVVSVGVQADSKNASRGSPTAHVPPDRTAAMRRILARVRPSDGRTARPAAALMQPARPMVGWQGGRPATRVGKARPPAAHLVDAPKHGHGEAESSVAAAIISRYTA
jgi:hypothetical protein